MNLAQLGDAPSFKDPQAEQLPIETGAYTDRNAGKRSNLAVNESTVSVPAVLLYDDSTENARNITGGGGIEVPSKDKLPYDLVAQKTTKQEFENMIKEFDSMLPPEQVPDAVRDINTLIQALESGHNVKRGPDGFAVVDPASTLSDGFRWEFHKAAMLDFEKMYNQVAVRGIFAVDLATSGSFLRSASMFLDTRKKANEFAKSYKVDDREVSPVDLMRKQAQLLKRDEKLLNPPAPIKEAIKQYLNALEAPETGFIAVIENSSNVKKK